jgi:hypothetical protein
MSKKWLLLLPLIPLFLCIQFRQEILDSAAEWKLQRWSKQIFHGKIQYEKVERVEDRLVFTHLKTLGDDHTLALEAEKLSVGYALHLFSREMDLDIAVVKPTLSIGEKADLSSIFEQVSDASSFWNLREKYAVEQGLLKLKMDPGNPFAEHVVHFDGSLALDDHTEGEWRFFCGDESQGAHAFTCSLEGTSHTPLSVTFDFSQADCLPLSLLSHSFVPASAQWTAVKGALSGKMTLTFPKRGVPYGIGNLSIQGLTLKRNHPGVELDIGEAEVHLVKPTSALPGVLSPIEGEFHLSRGGALTLRENGIPYFQVADLNGKITWGVDDAIKALFQGVCLSGDPASNDLPKKLKIDGNFRGEAADFKLAIDDLSSKKALVHLSAQEIGSPIYYAAVNLENIGHSEFTVFQHLLSTLAPHWDYLSLHEGNVSALLKTTIAHGNVTEIALENIEARDIACDLPALDLAFRSEKVAGQFSINLASENLQQSCNAELSVVNGELKLAGLDREYGRFTNIQTKLKVKQGVFEKSLASVELAGLKGSAEVNWQSPKEVVKIDLNGAAKDLSRLIPLEIKNRVDKAFQDDHLTLHADVYRMARGVRWNG